MTDTIDKIERENAHGATAAIFIEYKVALEKKVEDLEQQLAAEKEKRFALEAFKLDICEIVGDIRSGDETRMTIQELVSDAFKKKYEAENLKEQLAAANARLAEAERFLNANYPDDVHVTGQGLSGQLDYLVHQRFYIDEKTGETLRRVRELWALLDLPQPGTGTINEWQKHTENYRELDELLREGE